MRQFSKYKDGLSARVWADKLGITQSSFIWRIKNNPNKNNLIYHVGARKTGWPKGKPLSIDHAQKLKEGYELSLRESVRRKARLAGNKYYHGKPCRKGHTKRYVTTTKCVECSKEKCRNRSTIQRREYGKNYRTKNKTKLKAKYHGTYALKRYYNGPSNPEGELQWLRKTKAILRQAKRIIRNSPHAQSPYLSEEFKPVSSSPGHSAP